MVGRAVEMAHIGNEIQTTASDLGLPPGQFPSKIRMRDDENKPHWFRLEKIISGAALYSSGDMRLTVYDDQPAQKDKHD